MRVAGIAMLAVSACLLLGGLNVALTQYDLGSAHDVSKFCGGLSFASLLAAVGVVLIRKARAETDRAKSHLAPPRGESEQDSQEGMEK